MSSGEFLLKFESGELGDSQDFFRLVCCKTRTWFTANKPRRI